MKTHAVVGALLALTLVVTFDAFRSRSGPSENAVAPGADHSGLVWNIAPNGPTLRYDLEAEAHGDSHPDAILQPNAEQSNVFSGSVLFRGTLELTGVSETRDGRSFAIRILEGRTSVRLATGEGDIAGLADALRRWSRVTRDLSGRITRVSVAPNHPDAADGLIRSLLGTLQLLGTSAAGGGNGAWETTEEDSNGRYLARYVVEPDSTPESLLLHKVKTRYLPPPPDPEELSGAVELVPGGSLRARIHRASGTLESLDSEEYLETRIANRTIGSSRTRVSLTRVADGPRLGTAERQALTAELSRHAPGRSLSAPSPERELAMHREQLGDSTAEELIDRLTRDVGSLPSGSRTDLTLSLEALVRVHPEACTLLEAPLSTLTEATALRLLASALVRAGHADAQRILARVLRLRASDTDALTVLIPAAGNLSHPTTGIEKTLFELSEQPHPTVAGVSRLALGVLSRHLRDGSPERADRIAVWAARELREADAGDDAREFRVIQWLHVLGNAASLAHLRPLLDYCGDRRTHVREAAHWALRFLHDPTAMNRLAASLTNDPSPAVRAAAASALGFSEPRIGGSGIDAQRHALGSDSDVAVRRTVVHALARWASRFPEIEAILRDVADSDPDSAVRGDAKRRNPASAGFTGSALPEPQSVVPRRASALGVAR